MLQSQRSQISSVYSAYSLATQAAATCQVVPTVKLKQCVFSILPCNPDVLMSGAAVPKVKQCVFSIQAANGIAGLIKEHQREINSVYLGSHCVGGTHSDLGHKN